MNLRQKFLNETSAFLSKVLRAKGMIDAEGRPIDQGASPLDMDLATGKLCIVETEGVEIDDSPTEPDIDIQALLQDGLK